MGTDLSTDQAVAAVRAALHPSLLSPSRRPPPGAAQTDADRMRGHCYVASEAVYHLLGGKAAGLKPASVRHEGDVHWFLRQGDTIIDPTADQFSSPPPYDSAQNRGFLTRSPSARARRVMQTVLTPQEPR